MEEELLIKLLSNIGVPAAVCFYTLWGVNRSLRELTGAINKLTSDVDSRITRLEAKVDFLQKRGD